MGDLPAILGGEPSFPAGPPPWPLATPGVREAIDKALTDGTWGKYDGGHVSHLEAHLASWVGRAHALAVGSGTHGLDLALRALGVGPGDGVILCDYDYPGNFLTVHGMGARPVLVDIEPRTGQMCHRSLEEALASSQNPAIKVVVASPVHGALPDFDRLREVCQNASVPLIEDACQAVGATWKGKPCGSLGLISLWSFGGSKLLSAGRGGMVFTDDARLNQRMKMANSRASVLSPLSELQAVALWGQLPDFFRARELRHAAAKSLDDRMGRLGLVELPRAVCPDAVPSWYKWDLFWKENEAGLPVGLLVEALRKEGIAADVGFRSLSAGRSRSRFVAPVSLEHSHRTCPVRVVIHHPVLLETQAPQRIAGAFRKILEHRKTIAAQAAGPGAPTGSSASS